MQFFLLLMAVILHSSYAHGQAEPLPLEKLAQNPRWLKLLHYEKKLLSLHSHSLADGPDFFLAPDGATNPLHELEATLHHFHLGEGNPKKIGPLKLSPLCAFAARREFLESSLMTQFPKIDCPQLDELMNTADPESVALVFSTSFANNPPSMMGHTFLRFHHKGSNSDLLDLSVSYAARTSEENGVLFAYLGLTGGYPGFFSFLPYYLKVSEYSQSENRDLWEYELNLSPQETRFLLKHIWELYVATWFDYYFFDENCSSMLMALLDTIHPEWKLSPDLFYTLPHETVQKLTRIRSNHPIRSIKFRPSLRRQALKALKQLSAPERNEALRLAGQKETPTTLEVQQTSLPVLLATLAVLRFKAEEKTARYAQILSAIAASSQSTPTPLAPSSEEELNQSRAPHFSHNPRRVGLSLGILNAPTQMMAPSAADRPFFRVSAHSMTHDLLNRDDGWAELSHMEFPSITLGFYPAKNENHFRVNIENLELLHIKSLFPFNDLEKKISWSFRAHYTALRDFPAEYSCSFCHVLSTEGGAGFTAFQGDGFLPSPWLLGILHINAGSALRHTLNLGPILEVGALWSLRSSQTGTGLAKLLLQARHGIFFPTSYSFSRLTSALSVTPWANLDFRLEGSLGFAAPGNPYSAAAQKEASLTSDFFF